MEKQRKWSLMRIIGSILICIGLVATAVVTQGTSAIFEIISLSSLFIGICLLAYGLAGLWCNKEGK